ncbi:hypothetical protein, partial [Enterobacter asburiae]|uniref:hypothetical protein n=1 Tax=Enterobacter asburiae TaxID=61645 RepID=UPI003D68544F
IECAKACFTSAVTHGDMTMACFAACHQVINFLSRGDHLDLFYDFFGASRPEVASGLSATTGIRLATLKLSARCSTPDSRSCLKRPLPVGEGQ